MRILCVEDDPIVRDTRCAVLESSNYHAVSASTKIAEILLTRQKFDLVVLSGASQDERTRISAAVGGGEILSLAYFISPTDLLGLVAEKLKRRG